MHFNYYSSLSKIVAYFTPAPVVVHAESQVKSKGFEIFMFKADALHPKQSFYLQYPLI